MRKFIIITSLFLSFLTLSCSEESIFDPEVEQVVIQAYLFAGEDITNIRVTHTFPLGDDSLSTIGINDATVQLLHNDDVYDLTVSEGDSGYYHYTGDDLIIQENEDYHIEIDYKGIFSSANTSVPEKPANLLSSGTSISIPEDYSPKYFVLDSSKHLIELSWDGEPDGLYFISIKNIEENPDSIVFLFGSGGGGMKMGKKGFISEPTSATSYTIQFQVLEFYGRHEIKVYTINQEYADLYISRQQDSRDLNEPISNIENGLGVFSAFSGVSLYFEAIKEE
ncbi:MAG: DUF4249 family protein [Candidatus Marinimicrobia bacterium]|nr:DUF4249 family protein [Candidatus Neomarinimicrobiota bacterium]